jgi:membrane-bound serine protease (ClpP class)
VSTALALLLVMTIAAAAAMALLVLLRPTLVEALVTTRRRARGTPDGLVGEIGVVRQPLSPLGQVLVGGELWQARRSWAEDEEFPIAIGDAVVVERSRGLTVFVRRAEDWEVE